MKKIGLLIVSLFLVVVLIAGGLNYAPASAQTQTQQNGDGDMRRTIQVTGAGSASAQPDTAVIIVGVRTQAEEASAALDENNQQANALIDRMRQAGIAADDIQTQRINLFPRYADQPNETGQPDITGYEATNTIQVHVRDIDQVGEILDSAVLAGGNIIEGIRFEVSDQQEAMQQAREAAFTDARQKAEQLANLAGVQLGDLVSISESTSGQPLPYGVGGRGEVADAAVPVEPGTQDIQLSLWVTWEITGGQASGPQATGTPIIPRTGTAVSPTPLIPSLTPTTRFATPAAGTATPTTGATSVVITATPTTNVTTPEVGTAVPTIDVNTPTSEATADSTGSSADELLLAQGASVQYQGTIQQPFFPVTGQLLVVNGEQLQVFAFNNEADAQAAADVISRTSSQASTLFSANVYHAGDTVILYFGSDTATLNLLSRTFGDALTG